MAVIISDTGAVTSWAGSGNSGLISGGAAPHAFSLSAAAAAHDVTPLGTLRTMAYHPGLKDWGGSISVRLSPSVLGEAGFITSTGPYLTNLIGWTMDLSCPAIDITPQTGGTATGVKQYTPGLFSWGGTWTANVDSTTALVLPGASQSATFRLVDATTDHTLAGTILTTGLESRNQIGDVAVATYNYQGSGDITAAGSGSPLFAVSPVPRPVVGALVLTAATGRTYTGDAFWESISISVQPDAVISAEIRFKGTGTLTVA